MPKTKFGKVMGRKKQDKLLQEANTPQGMENTDLNKLEKQILAFNNDPDVFALRSRYSTKTFLDIMSVSRSENRHSAFLAWLLSGSDFAVPHQDHPIVHLLDSIMMNMGDKNTIDDKLKEIILTRDIKSVEIEEVKTEKTLGELCLDINGRPLKGLPKLDRIDIYIRFSIIRKTKEESLDYEIIIENKIGSSEGGCPTGKYAKAIDKQELQPEFKAPQTVRYFNACTHDKRVYKKPRNGSIFIYLTPDGTKDPESQYFIHITYQDILDNIIEPLLLPDVNISDRVRLLLEEYISSLSLPAYEQSDDSEENEKQIKDALIMAVRANEKEQLLKLWQGDGKSSKGYSNLLNFAINAYNNSTNDQQLSEQEKILKRFCEVNKALIIAILRIATESKTADKELQQAYKDLIKSQHDYSTFDIFTTDNNSDEPTVSLGKGKMFLWIVKRWTEKLPNDIDIVQTLARLTPDNIICANDYKAKKEKKPDIEKRYFKPEDSISIDDQTYYLSNQWGIGDRLNFWLEFLGFNFKQFNDAVNGDTYTKEYSIEQVEQNRDGEKLMRDLGIKSITWTKIMK